MAVQIQLERMSVEEKLDLIQEIWESTYQTGEDIPSPEWHGAVIAERLARAAEGKVNYTPLEEVFERLEQQFP